MLSSYSLCILFSLYATVQSAVQVCQNPTDYYNPFATTCSLQPDGHATPTQILQRWGCTVVESNLATDDGYEFLVIRAFKGTITSSTPIIMAHGIYVNSRSFLSMYNQTLAYNLLQSGYQIYFINFRGTIYSTTTTNGMTQADYGYWNYSFHHLGVHEVRKTVDLVFTKTGQKSLLIGYSMGSTASFVFTSLYPTEAATKIKGLIALAPVAILNPSIQSALGKLSPFWPEIQPLAKLFFNGKLLPRNELFLNFCAAGPIQMLIYYSTSVAIFGIDYDSLDFATRPVGVVNNADAIGETVVTHYSQVINSGKFKQFNYGPDVNNQIYGSSIPPLYPLGNISIPVTLIVGNNDWLATPQTSQATWNSLSASARCKYITVPYQQMAHDGFIMSKYQYESIYQPLLTTISNMENGSCA